MAHSWTETDIAAFLDGELAGAERERVARIIAADPEAQALLDELRGNDALLREAFSAPLTEETPANLAIPPEATTGDVLTFRPRPRAPRSWTSIAMAASIALVVGGAMGAFFADRGASPSVAASLAVGPAPAPLARALDAALSGEVRDGVRPIASFALPQGGTCREFETEAADGVPAAFGMACGSDGAWQVLIAGAIVPAAGAAEDGYDAASGAALDAAGAVLDALNAGPALSSEEERASRDRGWL